MKKILSILTALIALIISMSFAYAASSIYIFPSKVNVGEDIFITVNPDVGGIYKHLYVYNQNNIYKQYLTLSCPSYICYNPINTTFNIPSAWANGTYTIKAYDYGQRNYILAAFEVTGSDVTIKNTTVQTYPEQLSPSDQLLIFISPGTEGISKYGYFYTSSNMYKQSIMFDCAASKCFDDINTSFVIPSNWVNGEYKLMIYDYMARQYVNSYFEITGSNITLKNASVNISPTSLQPGERLSININPGTDGVYRYAYVYDFSNKYKSSINLGCPNYICYNTIQKEFIVPEAWEEGVYSIRVYDYTARKYITKSFEITLPISCYNDSDCGYGQTFNDCLGNSSRTHTNYSICISPGQPNSYCQSHASDILAYCQYGCQNGACNPPSNQSEPFCIDGDENADKLYIKSTCTDNTGTYTDYCEGNNTVVDYYCGGTWNGTAWITRYCDPGRYVGFCSNGCQDGACLQSQTGSFYIVTQPPGANAYVDTIYKGLTPLTVSSLSPGYHNVKLNKTGYVWWSNNRLIIAGQITVINETLHLIGNQSNQTG